LTPQAGRDEWPATLDPELKCMLDMLGTTAFAGFSAMTPDGARRWMREFSAKTPPGPELPKVEDKTIPGPDGPIPARIYTPEGEGPFPLIVWFHGGGWVVGSIDDADPFVRRLVEASDCVAVSVGYRLAPEHRYPAAIDDCFAATQWLAGNAAALGTDPTRLVVAGDSAGGNLAAAVAIRARDAGRPAITFQYLVCPVTDHDFTRQSYIDNADGYMTTTRDVEWFWGHYAPEPSARNAPDASPLRASSLEGLPPALVVTADLDPLRDEGEEYARRLTEAGVPTRHRRYAGVIHDFCILPVMCGLDALTEHAEEIGATVAAAGATAS
jgi:acetyl esterase